MRFVNTLGHGIVVAAALGALASLAALFSAHHLFFDLISHFRIQYIVLLAPAFLLAIVQKKTLSVLIISLALAVHTYAVTMSILPLSGLGNDAEHTELTVFNSNLLLENNKYQEMLDLIDEVSPDVIALQEYTHEWHDVLSASLANYPFKVTHPSHGAFGIAIYSKYPLSGTATYSPVSNNMEIASAGMTLGNNRIQLLSVHPPPPVSDRIYAQRNSTMKQIAMAASNADDQVIVMGDFNATPWTSHYADMSSAAQLHNARAGFGFHPTWPNNNFVLQIPIDHILISDRIRATAFGSRKLAGSDHRAIWSTLRVYDLVR